MNAPKGDSSPAPALADFLLLNEEIAALVRRAYRWKRISAQIRPELPANAGELAGRIGRRLSTGDSLPAAIEAECASMPAIYRATILAGMESGRLGGAIESLVETATRLDQLRRITGMALLYPIVVATVASLAFALVITRVVPEFDWLNRSHFGPLAWLANFPQAVTVAAIAVPCLVALVAVWWWRRSGKVGGIRPSRFGILDWIPGTRRVRYWNQATTFAELLLLLVESNLPLDHALRLTAEAIDDRRLRDAAHYVAGRIQRGDTAWSRDANERDPTRHAFPLLIRLALYHSTNRSLLTAGLRQAAALYRERAVCAAEWYAEYAPILLTVVLGGTLTLCFALFVLWPYVSTLNELSGSNWR